MLKTLAEKLALNKELALTYTLMSFMVLDASRSLTSKAMPQTSKQGCERELLEQGQELKEEFYIISYRETQTYPRGFIQQQVRWSRLHWHCDSYQKHPANPCTRGVTTTSTYCPKHQRATQREVSPMASLAWPLLLDCQEEQCPGVQAQQLLSVPFNDLSSSSADSQPSPNIHGVILKYSKSSWFRSQTSVISKKSHKLTNHPRTNQRCSPHKWSLGIYKFPVYHKSYQQEH